MDIKERSSPVNDGQASKEFPLGGFAGMSNRTGKKPIIIACNGHAHGKLGPRKFISYWSDIEKYL
jgi:hypothetical protein